MVGAVALVVLGACGATLVAIPARPASLLSRSNWNLAQALPTYRDFPSDWNYALQGLVRRRPLPLRAAVPAAVYAPSDCGNVPKILGLYDAIHFAAMVHVDPSKDDIASATVLSSDEPDHHFRFIIWPVPDGRSLIADYLDWIGRCGSYSVSSTDPTSYITGTRTVSTTVVSHSGDAVAITRVSAETDDSQGFSLKYHVIYYAVRGIVLECATNLAGADVDLMKKLADQTLHRLRTL